MSRSAAIAVFLALALAAATDAWACCVSQKSKIVAAQLIRCESARPYIDAALPGKLERFDTQFREEHREFVKDYNQRNPGTIIVVYIATQLMLPGETLPSQLGADQEWRDIWETGRYWWRGSLGECQALKSNSLIHLHIGRFCCDTPPGHGPCLADFDPASPIPSDLEKQVAHRFKGL